MKWWPPCVLAIALTQVVARAGADESTNPTGIRIAVDDAEGRAGEAVVTSVHFSPGPSDDVAGGKDEIASLRFKLHFSGLDFGSIGFNPDHRSDLTAFALLVFNPETAGEDGFLDLVVEDPTRTHVLPDARLLQITFGIPTTTATAIAVAISDLLAKDILGTVQAVDEIVDGQITGLPANTPTITATPTSTRTPTNSPVPPTNTPSFTATPLPTRTPAPPTATPPPGCVIVGGTLVCSTGENGGCSLRTGAPGNSGLLAFALPFVWWRRQCARKSLS
ncbi:MAG TPA: hypothetical protein VMW17_09890 [Candidatus Binatia bacterium]|nr:hypothetical protein [Candidatus Binatia bacterium]